MKYRLNKDVKTKQRIKERKEEGWKEERKM